MAARILVVDDEPSISFMIRQIFRKELKAGTYVLSFAANGVEALAALDAEPFDIVLSDINMPEMDGLELLEQIYARHPRVRTVMVSAYSDMPRVRHAMNYGAFDFITKPLEAEDLRNTVAKLWSFITRDAEQQP